MLNAQESLFLPICLLVAGAALTHTDPINAQSDFTTAGEVLRGCEAPLGSTDNLICNGYIRGIMRRDDLARWLHPETAYACELPKGVTYGQLIAVVVKHIKARPESWHIEGAGVALTAIKEAFCKSENAEGEPKK